MLLCCWPSTSSSTADKNSVDMYTVFTGLGTVIRNTTSDELIMHQYSLAIVISKSNSEEG